MLKKIVVFTLSASSMALIGMDKPQLPVETVKPSEQLRQSVYSRIDSHDVRLEKVEGGQKALTTELRLFQGEVDGRLDTLHKRINAESRTLQALIDQKTRESRAETAQVRARVDLLETSLAQETANRQAADAELAAKIVTESQARQAAITRLEASITAESNARQAADARANERIDNTQYALVGFGAVSVIANAVCHGFTWSHNSSMGSYVQALYTHVNKDIPNWWEKLTGPYSK